MDASLVELGTSSEGLRETRGVMSEHKQGPSGHERFSSRAGTCELSGYFRVSRRPSGG